MPIPIFLQGKVVQLRLLLIFFGIVTLFLPLSFAPLFDLDEGAFSEATREMLHSGNYLTTYLDGALRFDKPILIYWLQAFSVKLFGLNEFALRFPSALAGAVWALAIWSFTKRYFSEKSAFFATLFMLASLQINIITKAAIADSLLNLFIATSIFSAWSYIKSNKKSYLYASFALIALGTLTKGPVAIMIPLIVVTSYLLIKKRYKLLLKSLFNPIGILIFLAIAAPWYILEYLDQGQKFIDGFFLKHNLERFSSTLESHRGSLLYYIPVILVGFLPFTSILIGTIKRVKTIFKDNLQLYLLIWALFVIIFFSLSGTKLPHYVIYGYTPLFILMGYEASKRFKSINFLTLMPIIVLFIILFILPFAIKYIDIKNLYIKEMLADFNTIFNYQYLIYVALAAILTVALKYSKLKIELKAFFIALIFTSLVNFVVIPSYGKLAQQPIKDAALYAKKHNLKIIRFHITKPSFLVYLESKSLKKEPSSGDVLLLKAGSLKRLKSYKVLFNKGGIYLVKLK